MKIFANLVFEFLRKIVLFSFWFDKNDTYYIYDCSYNKWKYDYEIHYFYLPKKLHYFLLNYN